MKRQIFCLVLFPFLAFTQAKPLLSDLNGDGIVRVATFGDSITFGVGDGVKPGEFFEELPPGTVGPGYPGRLENYLGVDVRNLGLPGEVLVGEGDQRFISTLRAVSPDIVILLEGANDAVFKTNASQISRSLQRAINVTLASGSKMVLGTTLPPVSSKKALAPFTDSYADRIEQLASVNQVGLADFRKGWRTSCPDLDNCQFYNLPEGLHPNTLGYDAMSQIAAASLLGIDIFSATGASELEQALALPAGAVVVKPEQGAVN